MKFLLPLWACAFTLGSSQDVPNAGKSSNGSTLNSTTYSTNCPAANWPLASVGQAQLQEPDDELRAALADVDPSRIKSIIVNLVGFGTRHTLSTQTDPNRGIGAARDWIASEMQKFANASGGRMEITIPSYRQNVTDGIAFPVQISNVVATLKGSVDPQRVYVLTGHYDSRVTDLANYKDDAPGANDDASGVAGKAAINGQSHWPLGPHACER